MRHAPDNALTRSYDRRQRETAPNRFDQFTTEIDGLEIHFIHQRYPHTDAFPIALTHLWPGSAHINPRWRPSGPVPRLFEFSSSALHLEGEAGLDMWLIPQFARRNGIALAQAAE